MVHFFSKYTAEGIVEKNKNLIPDDMFQLLASSDIAFIKTLTSYSIDLPNKSANSKKARTINAQFRDQLAVLMTTITSTKTHYVRCIKSNDMNQQDCLERQRLVEQLKCAGVMEAVRISRSGYPYRMSFVDFYSRYRLLIRAYGDALLSPSLPLRVEITNPELPQLCRQLFRALQDSLFGTNSSSNNNGFNYRDATLIQMGRTKVFLRKEPYDVLEAAREHQLSHAARKMLSMFRGYQAKRAFTTYRSSARTIQRAFKTFQLNKFIKSRIFKKVDSLRRRRLEEEQREQERMLREKRDLERRRLEAEEAERQRMAAEEKAAMVNEGMSEQERQQEAKRREFEMKVKMYIENIKNREWERRLADLQSKGVQVSLQ